MRLSASFCAYYTERIARVQWDAGYLPNDEFVREMASTEGLDREQHVDDVSVLDDVGFAFGAHNALAFGFVPPTRGE